MYYLSYTNTYINWSARSLVLHNNNTLNFIDIILYSIYIVILLLMSIVTEVVDSSNNL